jgi:SsrA-binding protein
MKLYARNKRAKFDYEILDKYEAGLVLTGAEAKSIRNGGANVVGGFVFFEKGEPWLHAVNIRKWTMDSDKKYDPFRKRKLLLKGREVFDLIKKTEQKGITLVPLSFYPKGKVIKAELGLVRGKKSEKKDEVKNLRRRMQIK